MFFRFVTKHACDGQTDEQNYDPQDRASIAASLGKNRLSDYITYNNRTECNDRLMIAIDHLVNAGISLQVDVEFNIRVGIIVNVIQDTITPTGHSVLRTNTSTPVA